MKLRSLIIDILCMLFIIPFYYITKNHDIFLYTISIYLYFILSSVFMHIDIYDNLKEYYDKKYIYSLNTIYKYTNTSIILINIVLSIFVCIISILLNKLFHIKGFVLVNTIMSLTLFIVPILKNASHFALTYTFDRLSKSSLNIYKVITLILYIISSLLCFRIIKLDDYISISILYGCNIISFTLVYLLIYLIVLKNKIKKKQFKKREERINYVNIVKEILSRNIHKSIKNIFKYSYFYISIVILYFILKNRYNYSYIDLTNIINNGYLYALSIVNIILIIFNYFEKDNIEDIKNNIVNKKYDLIKLDEYLIKIFKILLTNTVIISIISNAIWLLLFNNSNGYILFMFINLSLFYIIYILINDITISNKKYYLINILGLVIKLILIVPLINALYRMGYNLLYGDILSTIISYLLVTILLIVVNNKKYNIDFKSKFDKILNIVYYNIILCLILLLFSLIIPVKVNSIFSSIKVIVLYLLISFVYMFIRKKMNKNERIITINNK